MEARELRIGNWVKRNSIVVQCDFMSVANCHAIPDQYEPIPITEYWLEIFGFNGLSKEDSNGFELIYNNAIGYRLSIQGQYQYKEIKYIHELQNLYFALTGKELEIKR